MSDQSEICTHCGRVLVQEGMYGVEHSMSLDSGDIDYWADHTPQEMATDE
jgi:hypothetical protein